MKVDLLKDLLVELKTYLNRDSILIAEIIRSEQAGEKPEFPYASYKITSKDNLNYNNREPIENPDLTKYSEKFTRKEKIVVSFVLVGTVIFDLFDLADKCYDFLNIESYEFQKENQIKIEILNQVQDRTIFLDTEYENRVGFDFEIRGIGELTRTLDAIDIEATTEQVEINISE